MQCDLHMQFKLKHFPLINSGGQNRKLDEMGEWTGYFVGMYVWTNAHARAGRFLCSE